MSCVTIVEDLVILIAFDTRTKFGEFNLEVQHTSKVKIKQIVYSIPTASCNRKTHGDYIYSAREWIGVEGLLLSGEVEKTDKSEFPLFFAHVLARRTAAMDSTATQERWIVAAKSESFIR